MSFLQNILRPFFRSPSILVSMGDADTSAMAAEYEEEEVRMIRMIRMIRNFLKNKWSLLPGGCDGAGEETAAGQRWWG